MDSNTYHTCIKSNAIIEYLCNPLCLNVEIIEESGHNVLYFVRVCQDRNILFLLYLSQWIDVL